MKTIEIRGLSFFYGEHCVFKQFSADFIEGCCTAVMAKSGAGKTTLLYLIGRLLYPYEGEINYSVNYPLFSYVFQENRLIENVSAVRNIKLVNHKLSLYKIKEQLLSIGFTSESVNKKIRDMSGGEKRRISILRALLADYNILLLDEPFTGLDRYTKQLMIECVKKNTIGKTVIIVTHNEEEAISVGCSKIIYL